MLRFILAATILIVAITLAIVYYAGHTEDGSIVSLIQCETDKDYSRRYEHQCTWLGVGLVTIIIPTYLILFFVWTALWRHIRQAKTVLPNES